MSAKNFHRETVIEHDEPVTVRLSGGEQIIFWIEEDGSLSPESPMAPAPELRLEPTGQNRRPPKTPSFQVAQRPVAVTVEELTVMAHAGSKLRVRRARGVAKQLVEGVSFTLEPGQLIAAIGPSGAGKSTVMRAIIGDVPCERKYQVQRDSVGGRKGGRDTPTDSIRAAVRCAPPVASLARCSDFVCQAPTAGALANTT